MSCPLVKSFTHKWEEEVKTRGIKFLVNLPCVGYLKQSQPYIGSHYNSPFTVTPYYKKSI